MLTRRRFIGGATAAGTAGVLGTNAVTRLSQAGAQQGNQRNVLLLYIDDLRDWVGYLDSHPGVKTPNIDALRAESFSFDNAYCSVPSCLGSRASMMWGISPHRAGVEATGGESLRSYARLVNSGRLTIPEVLGSRGWTTYNRGKVFHNALPGRWSVSDTYRELPQILNRRAPSYRQTLFEVGVMPASEVHEDQRTADWFTGQIANPRLPFFMAVGLYQPHVPWRVPKWAFDQHPINDVVIPEPNCQNDLADVPRMGKVLARRPVLFNNTKSQNQLVNEKRARRRLVQAYLASITHTDAMVGQIMDALAASRHDDNTTVMLVSDHGYHLGEKLHWRKSTLWNQATRVPLLVRTPGLAAGGRFAKPVSLLDAAPTILDMAGAGGFQGFTGKSLVGITRREADGRPAIMHWEGNHSIRWRNFRYTLYAGGGRELYDLASDPSECTNLIGQAAHRRAARLLDTKLRRFLSTR